MWRAVCKDSTRNCSSNVWSGGPRRGKGGGGRSLGLHLDISLQRIWPHRHFGLWRIFSLKEREEQGARAFRLESQRIALTFKRLDSVSEFDWVTWISQDVGSAKFQDEDHIQWRDEMFNAWCNIMAYRLAAGTAVATNSNHLKSKCLRILYLEDSAVKII